jgi:hypothetical protein
MYPIGKIVAIVVRINVTTIRRHERISSLDQFLGMSAISRSNCRRLQKEAFDILSRLISDCQEFDDID